MLYVSRKTITEFSRFSTQMNMFVIIMLCYVYALLEIQVLWTNNQMLCYMLVEKTITEFWPSTQINNYVCHNNALLYVLALIQELWINNQMLC